MKNDANSMVNLAGYKMHVLARNNERTNKMEKAYWQEFKAASDAELKRRLVNHENWERLKRQCKADLRANSIAVREERDQIREKNTADIAFPDYSEWLGNQKFEDGEHLEPVEANPDVLPEPRSLGREQYTDGQKDAASKVLKEMRSLLTPNQFRIYQLHVENGLSLSEVAKELRVNVHSLHWPQIQQKLQKHFEALRGR